MLATVDHIADMDTVAADCRRVVSAVPPPRVDAVVALLLRLRLADGMSVDEHHRRDVAERKSDLPGQRYARFLEALLGEPAKERHPRLPVAEADPASATPCVVDGSGREP
jgi:hypothetical protein